MYVGDFGGYVDGDYPDASEVTDRATVFRALDRGRLLDGGSLECRIETAEGSSGAELHAAFVMPCEPDAYVSEREAAAFAHGNAPLEELSHGGTSGSTALAPGNTRRLTIPVSDEGVDEGGPSLERLRNPDHVDAIRRLSSFEERESVDPSDRFDLWVRGSDLSDPTSAPPILDRDGARAPADVGIVVSTDSVAIWYGLERERFLGQGGLELADETDRSVSSVEAVYAMPYAGSVAFRTPTRAAELLAEQPDEAKTFSLDSAFPG